MALNAVDKVLNHLLVHFIAQNSIVLHFPNMILQNVFNSKAPGRLHTWSLHGAGLGSGTAQGVCEEAPKSFHNDTQEQLDQGPDCFGLKDKSSEEIGERAS